MYHLPFTPPKQVPRMIRTLPTGQPQMLQKSALCPRKAWRRIENELLPLECIFPCLVSLVTTSYRLQLSSLLPVKEEKSSSIKHRKSLNQKQSSNANGVAVNATPEVLFLRYHLFAIRAVTCLQNQQQLSSMLLNGQSFILSSWSCCSMKNIPSKSSRALSHLESALNADPPQNQPAKTKKRRSEEYPSNLSIHFQCQMHIGHGRSYASKCLQPLPPKGWAALATYAMHMMPVQVTTATSHPPHSLD